MIQINDEFKKIWFVVNKSFILLNKLSILLPEIQVLRYAPFAIFLRIWMDHNLQNQPSLAAPHLDINNPKYVGQLGNQIDK